MFAEPLILPKKQAETKKPKRTPKKKAGTAKRTSKSSRGRTTRPRST
jgi:hypothetical protein